MTAISGGKFWSGFAAGSLSSIAASAWSGGNTVETKFEANSSLTEGNFVINTFSHQGISGAVGANNAIGMIAFGTVSGGVGARLTGGNFWQGAVTGLVVSGLNHYMHKIEAGKFISKAEKEITAMGYELNCIPEFSNIQVEEMVSKSPELSRLNNASHGKATFRLKDYFAKVYSEVLPSNPTQVNLYRNAFRNILDLFITVGHELGHVGDNLNHRSSWTPNTTYRQNHSEAKSYYWETIWNPTPSAYKLYNYYNNLAPLNLHEK